MVKSIGNKEYKAITGLQEIWLAPNTVSEVDESAYGEVFHLTNPVTYSVAVASELTPGHAGNRRIEVAQSRQGGSIQLELWNLPVEIETLITGATEGENGTVRYSSEDKSPYFGLIAKFTKEKDADGTSHDFYIGVPRVMFTLPSYEASTKQDSVEFQTISLEGELIEREYDKTLKIDAHESKEGFDFEGYLNDVFLNETKGEEGEETP